MLETIAEFDGERRETVSARCGAPLTVHHPIAGELKGVVLLVAGWSGTRCGPAGLLTGLASAFARAGWRAVRIDLPGRGDAPGDYHVNGLDEMIAATADTAREFSLSGKPCLLLGICSGGNTALGAVTLNRETREAITGVITLSVPPFQPAKKKHGPWAKRLRNIRNYATKALSPATWARLFRGEINLGRVAKNIKADDRAMAKTVAAGAGAGESPSPQGAGRNLKDSVRDIESELRGWKRPALFIFGDGDEETPAARKHYQSLCENGMGKADAVRFETVAGANHNFYGQAWRDEAARIALEFANTTCRN